MTPYIADNGTETPFVVTTQFPEHLPRFFQQPVPGRTQRTTAYRIATLKERDGDCCIHCQRVMVFGLPPFSDHAVTVEHIIPKARGGTSRMFNLSLAHRICNIKRGQKFIPQEMGVPTLADDHIFCHLCRVVVHDFDELLHHRLAAHGELSTSWIVEVAA